ncbi:hypothetical protein GXW77_07765 [Roseomonas alkaliterrae]|uniref:hypothetical protein n=1 Tax=Neoroseomonas alkaliterrae TaxID=1452450 RepID=UPI001BA44CD4|nr:hypothetical protein [Neoroseomonas alkaliterrae]MBR0676070.1 hypothetical protein [Neoroseomonas alkaliterrae]
MTTDDSWTRLAGESADRDAMVAILAEIEAEGRRLGEAEAASHLASAMFLLPLPGSSGAQLRSAAGGRRVARCAMLPMLVYVAAECRRLGEEMPARHVLEAISLLAPQETGGGRAHLAPPVADRPAAPLH